jgi:hypothetical protein
VIVGQGSWRTASAATSAAAAYDDDDDLDGVPMEEDPQSSARAGAVASSFSNTKKPQDQQHSHYSDDDDDIDGEEMDQDAPTRIVLDNDTSPGASSAAISQAARAKMRALEERLVRMRDELETRGDMPPQDIDRLVDQERERGYAELR